MSKSSNNKPGAVRSSTDSFINKDNELVTQYTTTGKSWVKSATSRLVEPNCVLPQELKSVHTHNDKDGKPVYAMRMVTSPFFANDFIPEEEREGSTAKPGSSPTVEELLARVNELENDKS